MQEYKIGHMNQYMMLSWEGANHSPVSAAITMSGFSISTLVCANKFFHTPVMSAI